MIETLEFVTDWDRREDLPVDETAVVLGVNKYHDAWQGKCGEMRVPESVMPTGPFDVFETALTFRESPQDIQTTAGETHARFELRADYYGAYTEDDDPKFVLRKPDTTDYSRWVGKLDFALEALSKGESVDFLDLSKERVTQPVGVRAENDDPDHHYPNGEPYSSYYVTVELEHAPDAMQ